jgi:signal transduction histidine kinase
MKRNWRRRNYFIKRELQGKYMFSIFLFVMAGSILLSVFLAMMSADTITIVYKDSSLQVGNTPVVLLRGILGANWLFIVIGGVVVTVLAMFLTHRLAGPVYRLERSIEQMIDGNFNFEIRLRSKDEIKELADMMNNLNTRLSDRLREMRELTEQVGSHLSEARESVSDEKVAGALEKAISLNGEAGRVLRGFKLKNDE